MRRQTHSQTTLSLIVALIGLGATAPGTAQGPEFDRCAELASDSERLACFDAALEDQNAATTAPAPPEVSTAAPAAPAERATPEPSASKVTPESAAAPKKAMPEESAGAPEPPRQQDEKRSAEPELPREYTAVVVAMGKRPHGQMAVTLNNGEVWSEQYASRAFLVDVGDTITMKKSRFTRSYRLVAPGGRGYKMTRLE